MNEYLSTKRKDTNMEGIKTKTKVDDKQDISKSKAKRNERKKALEKKKRNRIIARIIAIVIIVAIIGAIAFYVGKKIYLVAIRTTSNSNFSEGLNDDGTIADVDVTKYITLVDYKNIDIPADEVAATDEEVEDDINSTLESNKYVSDDSTLSVADGDVVNIDYVGTINDEEFDGGNSNGEGYDLTIGSGTFVDDFEDQLIGAHPGDVVTVEVTFPDDYSSDEVAGQDAVFTVTINGITVTPELTDDFVAQNLDIEGVTTADEYKAYVENNFYEEHLEDYITNYIVENSTINSYPKSYVKDIKGITKNDDEYMMSYYNQMYEYYGMSSYEFENLWDYVSEDGVTDELSYEKNLTTRAKDTVKTALVYQGIFEDAGLTLDSDEYLANLTDENGEDYTDSLLETYGQGYLMQTEIKNQVIDYLMDMYK
jgi:trigger factor